MKSLNIKGHLFVPDAPVVMGILNITPDSFYAASRRQSEEAINLRIEEILREGGAIIDVGGYSSHPDAAEVSPDEEMKRIAVALECLRTHYPDVPVSIDTFRPDIARRAVEDYGAAIINDISGGQADGGRMFETVAELHVPYVLMHTRGTPQTMQQLTDYDDTVEDVMLWFAEKIQTLRLMGVNDIIVDPGFGFAKTLEQNYDLMRALNEFGTFGCLVLVGISRKSMIYKLLDVSPDESLNGTMVVNAFALLNGADILRVHDVRAAVETVKLIEKLKGK